ncbi:MAG: hypothetical protein Q7R50_02995 [Dehalococcoidales bacterium]|nr:hypothetical protein [Dehalococcoidales bacterium]
MTIPTASIGSMPTVVPNTKGVALPTERKGVSLAKLLDTPTEKVSVVNAGYVSCGYISGGCVSAGCVSAGCVSAVHRHSHISRTAVIRIGFFIIQRNIRRTANTIPYDIANITGADKEKDNNNTLKQKSLLHGSTDSSK